MKKKPKHHKMIKKYESLPPLHQHIMQLKAICYKLRRKGDFSNAVQRSTLRTLDSKRLYPKHLNPILDKLVRVKLLDHDFNCNEQMLHYLTMHALDHDNKQYDINHGIVSDLWAHHGTLDIEDDSDLESHSIGDLRTVHVAVYMNNEALFLTEKKGSAYCLRLLILLRRLFYKNEIDKEWFATRKSAIQTAICLSKLCCYYYPYADKPVDFEWWLDYYRRYSLAHLSDYGQYPWQIDLALGLLDKVEHALKNQKTPTDYGLVTQATVLFLRGHHQEALLTYETALKEFRKRMNKRTWFFDDLHGLFYVLTIVAIEHRPTKALKSIRAVCKQNSRASISFRALEALVASI